MSEQKFEIGDLIWAKMKGYKPWPGRIVKPGPNIKKSKNNKGSEWVYFFGSNNYGWIEHNNIKPYHEYKNQFSSSANTKALKEAIKDIEDFIRKRELNPDFELQLPEVDQSNDDKVSDTDEEFNKLVSPSPKKQAKKSAKRPSEAGSKNSTSPSKKVRRSSPLASSEENGNLFLKSDMSKDFDASSNDDLASTSTTNLNNISELVKNRNIVPSPLSFGFFGLGVMGTGVVKNLIRSGHRVNLWNRTIKKCEEVKDFAETNMAGLVNVYEYPCDVVQNSDIIFSCLADPTAAKEVIFGNCGVLSLCRSDEAGLVGKSFVEMTSIDPETSMDFNKELTPRGARYLEAQMQGSRSEAENGNLVMLTAGDSTLFKDCQSCFKAMSKAAFFLGEVGYACKMNLVINLVTSVSLLGLAEAFVVADRSGLSLFRYEARSMFAPIFMNDSWHHAIKGIITSALMCRRAAKKNSGVDGVKMNLSFSGYSVCFCASWLSGLVSTPAHDVLLLDPSVPPPTSTLYTSNYVRFGST